ncbi:uncharacterized protein ARB_07677 [Trichophyton benhamiae CBS 112371]|uniref:Uncharacterized protein n=1 Tax=Arthroderma benhamiae (strain ATCC MYA-4681 / CBS 112371) TaxID=663331 RepID=D4AU47_ARTBC|nr:uncharacterized protein ARB_07677 [Trichophyton benhamiae CBS 112371]EFE33317.1 conserved hypothetical protein [Trichophyton benhamiae CBS 112371]
MPRPAAKRARATRNQPQTAKANATKGRPKRKISGGQSEERTTSTKSAPKSRVTSRKDANSSDVEGRSDDLQDGSSGFVQRERERDSLGSQTPVRDRQQENVPLSGGVMGDDSLDLGSSELGSDDLLGSFDPEDVSTPLPAKRRKSLNQADITPTVTKKTPKLPQVFVEVPIRHDLASEKRISDDPPALVQALGEQHADKAPEEPEDIDDPQEQEPALDEVQSEIPVAVDEDGKDDDCSSVGSVDSLTPMNFAIETPPQRRRQTTTLAPPESSLGSITPPASTPESSANQKPSPPPSKPTHLSTTSLQDALLPRRRQRGKGLPNKRSKRSRAGGKDYVLSASGSEDELNYTGGQQEDTSPGWQRNTKRSQQNQARFKLREKSQNTSQPKRGRGKAATVSSQPRKSSTPKKTYSRLSTTGGDADWDKENQLDEETGTSPEREIVAPVMSEELLLQKKKFAEIDEWSIDFEEVLDDDGEAY